MPLPPLQDRKARPRNRRFARICNLLPPTRTLPSGDQTQDELTFTGRIQKEKGALVLKDRVTKLTYQLDDQPRARKFIGRLVKVTGKLEMNSNTIQISRIEFVPWFSSRRLLEQPGSHVEFESEPHFPTSATAGKRHLPPVT